MQIAILQFCNVTSQVFFKDFWPYRDLFSNCNDVSTTAMHFNLYLLRTMKKVGQYFGHGGDQFWQSLLWKLQERLQKT